jgi:hypothetical protein
MGVPDLGFLIGEGIKWLLQSFTMVLCKLLFGSCWR